MARRLHKLSARAVATLSKPGWHSDGGNLYLRIDEDGRRRWVFVACRRGKRLEMGLGGASEVSLAEARAKAADARKLLAAGKNPIEARKAAREAEKGRKTFGEMTESFLSKKEAEWRNAKHRAQWRMTLVTYCASIWDKPVDEVDTDAVLSVLLPIWLPKNETASRLRGRIEAVLDAAKALGLRSGENPARWRGHLDKLLPKRQKLTRGHHAAMPYAEVPAFIGSLREREAIAALALEFGILTATRSGEVLGALWSEIDFEAKLWVVPATRTKAGREHRVPLSRPALTILERLAEARTGDFVFPGQRAGRPLSSMAMEMVLRRMKTDGVTVHGFRSAFRDWCGDCTHFPREIAEAALAHAVRDKTEAAYRRADALEKRRSLMEAWAAYLDRTESNIVALRA